jgi:hypothetical protein
MQVPAIPEEPENAQGSEQQDAEHQEAPPVLNTPHGTRCLRSAEEQGNQRSAHSWQEHDKMQQGPAEAQGNSSLLERTVTDQRPEVEGRS